VVGKEPTPGRPILYGTTSLFLEVFGLNKISNLPSLAELDMDQDAGKTDPPAGENEKLEKLRSLAEQAELPNLSGTTN